MICDSPREIDRILGPLDSASGARAAQRERCRAHDIVRGVVANSELATPGTQPKISRIQRYFRGNDARCPSCAARISLIAFGGIAVWFRRAHAHLTLLTAMADLLLQGRPSLAFLCAVFIRSRLFSKRLFLSIACIPNEKPLPTKVSWDMNARAAQ